MPCKPEVLRGVSLFSLLDEEEAAVLASQVELKTFAPRQRIYKAGDPGGRAYVVVSGAVNVTGTENVCNAAMAAAALPLSASTLNTCDSSPR